MPHVSNSIRDNLYEFYYVFYLLLCSNQILSLLHSSDYIDEMVNKIAKSPWKYSQVILLSHIGRH